MNKLVVVLIFGVSLVSFADHGHEGRSLRRTTTTVKRYIAPGRTAVTVTTRKMYGNLYNSPYYFNNYYYPGSSYGYYPYSYYGNPYLSAYYSNYYGYTPYSYSGYYPYSYPNLYSYNYYPSYYTPYYGGYYPY